MKNFPDFSPLAFDGAPSTADAADWEAYEAARQKLIPGKWRVEELFDDVTRGLA